MKRLGVISAAGVVVAAALAGCGDDGINEPAAGQLSFASVSAGSGFTCGVTTAEVAYCWGNNRNGALGEGTTTTHRTSPVAVAGGLGFAGVSAGIAHACGVTTGGAAHCWGLNDSGQLGDGTTTGPATTPVAVEGGLSFASLSAGDRHTCGVTTGGAAYCWGANLGGRLGTGTTTIDETTPVAVAGGLSFASVSAGTFHSCGVTPSGAAYCWGQNDEGQLGDGTTTGPATTPVAVEGGLSFASLSAWGFKHTCGVTTGGAAYCWGLNDRGQLGNGSTFDRTSPVAVEGGLSFVEVSAGIAHTCGVTTDGAAYCWGSNSSGQLGDGTRTDRATPVAVAGGLRFASLGATGFSHSCGVTADGTAYCWGSNSSGQLGDATTTDRTRPVRVMP